MSRSNPTDNSPNPATRWFEWDGSGGTIRWYDKTAKKNIELPPDFTFILLDELATIKGWHERSESGIYSNEVKDTRSSPFVVKAFKGGPLAEGLYANIRDRIVALGGHFTTNCYIAFKDGAALRLGSIQFKGAALNAWVDFRKEHQQDIYKMAVQIKGYKDGKKGKIEFRTPVFFLRDITPETDKAAIAIDAELQKYLKGYFGRTHTQQAAPPPSDDAPPSGNDEPPAESEQDIPEPEPDSIPF